MPYPISLSDQNSTTNFTTTDHIARHIADNDSIYFNSYIQYRLIFAISDTAGEYWCRVQYDHDHSSGIASSNVAKVRVAGKFQNCFSYQSVSFIRLLYGVNKLK